MLKRGLLFLILLAAGLCLWGLLLMPFQGNSTFAVTTAWYLLLVGLPLLLLKYSRLKLNNFWVAFFAVVLTLYVCEATLRYVIKYPVTYSERQWGKYLTFYDNPYNKTSYQEPNAPFAGKHLYTLEANVALNYQTPEYNYTGDTSNYLGLRGSPPLRTTSNLLALGDSYTESMGAPHDSTYPLLLEKYLHQNNNSLQVVNAGVSGSDPFFEFVLLKEIHARCPISSAIFMVNLSDINDVMMRGGHSRFAPDGSLQYHKAPFWEPLYAVSFVFRLIMHSAGYNYSLMSAKTEQQKRQATIKLIAEHFKTDIIPWCAAHRVNLFIVLQPMLSDMQQPNTEYLALNKHLAPLHPHYFNMADSLATRTNLQQYYWPLDGHFNSRGYHLVAQLIYHRFFQRSTLPAQ
jgi:hypothetical protein